jgi:hypothetical protein
MNDCPDSPEAVALVVGDFVVHEHKEGTLKSGSGKKVRSRKQAVAIATHESGQSKKK